MSLFRSIIEDILQIGFSMVKRILPAPKWKKEIADLKEEFNAFRIDVYEKELHRVEKAYIKIKAEIQKHDTIVPDHLLEEKYRGKQEIVRLKALLEKLNNYKDPDEEEEE